MKLIHAETHRPTGRPTRKVGLEYRFMIVRAFHVPSMPALPLLYQSFHGFSAIYPLISFPFNSLPFLFLQVSFDFSFYISTTKSHISIKVNQLLVCREHFLNDPMDHYCYLPKIAQHGKVLARLYGASVIYKTVSCSKFKILLIAFSKGTVYHSKLIFNSLMRSL